MSYRPRILILPVAALIIGGLCAWRLANPRSPADPGDLPALRSPAPAFQLYDQDSTLVKLEAYLHRHQIVLVFFDGQAGPEASPLLTQLREFYPALKREGVIVMGISTALPQQIRNDSSQPFPFPVLCDAAATDPQSVHRAWDRIIEPVSLDKPAGTKPGVFLINRAGLVAWEGKYPVPESQPELILNRLLNGTAFVDR